MVKVMFVDAEYKGEISFNKELIFYIEKNKFKSIAIFASAQFLNLKRVEKQLEEIGIKFNIVTNIRRADVSENKGWVVSQGVRVDPITGDIVEG